MRRPQPFSFSPDYRRCIGNHIRYQFIILFIMSVASKLFRAGRLFVWQAKSQPKCLSLPELVTKTSIGPDHIDAIGQSGNLYSLGSGADGKLGHGDTKDHSEPKIVDYFQKHNIKVKDAVAGERHTIVLSDKEIQIKKFTL